MTLLSFSFSPPFFLPPSLTFLSDMLYVAPRYTLSVYPSSPRFPFSLIFPCHHEMKNEEQQPFCIPLRRLKMWTRHSVCSVTIYQRTCGHSALTAMVGINTCFGREQKGMLPYSGASGRRRRQAWRLCASVRAFRSHLAGSQTHCQTPRGLRTERKNAEKQKRSKISWKVCQHAQGNGNG